MLSLLSANEERRAERVVLKRIGLPRREFWVTISSQDEDVVIQESLDSLKHYFSLTRKYISKGDVLMIPLVIKEAECRQSLFPECRYYRVMTVEPINDCVAVFVDPSHTIVSLQSEYCSGFLPLSLEQYHYMESVLSEDSKVLEQEVMDGPLLPNWIKVAEVIAPVLVPKQQGLSSRLGLLLHGAVGKTTAILHAAHFLGLKQVVIDCLDLQCTSLGDLYQQLSSLGKGVSRFAPCVFILRHFHFLSKWISQISSSDVHQNGKTTEQDEILFTVLHELTFQSSKNSTEECVIFVSTCDNPSEIRSTLRHVFTHEIEIPTLSGSQMETLLLHQFHKLELTDSLSDLEASLEAIKEGLASPSPRELASISYRLRVQAETLTGDSKITKETIEGILESYRTRLESHQTQIEIPRVQWSDIGGLEDVKELIRETVELPIKHRTLFCSGLHKRLGVLLHGPPGVGKTLLAKAIATECKTKFISIKGPELLDMYVGETERMVRDLFEKAKKASPCVLFFDELDAFVPGRGAEDSGSVMDRVVSQFLAEMDEVSMTQSEVFIFGATNRLDLIDPALLRPGRFDKLVKVEPPRTTESRLSILSSLTRKFNLDPNIDLEAVVHEMGSDVSGADLYAICAGAWTRACKRCIQGLKSEGGALRENPVVMVIQEDFLESVDHELNS
eukprot:g3113.t1